MQFPSKKKRRSRRTLAKERRQIVRQRLRPSAATRQQSWCERCSANRLVAVPSFSQITYLIVSRQSMSSLRERACSFVSRRPGRPQDENRTPILVSVLHIERHCRRAPSIMTSKFCGRPTVADICKLAPVSERFRTVHSSLGALSPMINAPFLSIARLPSCLIPAT
jgi:hypothetical protein